MFSGTLPIVPCGDRLCGTVTADGQTVHVTALAVDTSGSVILIALAGSDTSVSAAMATLHENKTLTMTVAEEQSWSGPVVLHRCAHPMHKLSIPLRGTRLVHAVTLIPSMDIAEGIRSAPLIALRAIEPKTVPAGPDIALALAVADSVFASAGAGADSAFASADPVPQPPEPRFLAGNVHEESPARATFRGHLCAMRLPHVKTWVDGLWEQGCAAGLIVPVPAMGIRVWQLNTDLPLWSGLITRSLQSGEFAVPTR